MTRYRSYNANPTNNRVGDCAIRAISVALDQDWEKTYVDLCMQGFIMSDLPNADHVWGEYLKAKGFKRHFEDDIHMTVDDFCEAHQSGVFILCPKQHVIAMINGEFFDTWDSGNEVIIYYWTKGEE